MADSASSSVLAQSSLHWCSLTEVATRLNRGELTAVGLTEHMLQRINEHNNTLHCYCKVLDESALARAAQLDEMRTRGDALGPLHGVPIGLKDLLNTKGVVTASGTTVMANYIPTVDAEVVSRLERAGVVVLGKLQLTEGAYGEHHPDLIAPVNPWNKDLWPGVSSSGTGVSVASGLAFAALGSDTGGSIRFPSIANGVVGIKPTYGRVSRMGAFPLGESLDHIGPLARSVEDAARVLGAIAGYDKTDPNSLNAPVPDYLASLNGGVKGLRFGIDWNYAERGVEPQVVQTMHQVVSVLKELGAEVHEVQLPPDYKTLVRNWVVTCGVECALAHEGMFPEQRSKYGPDLTGLLELGRKVGGLQYGALERIRERFGNELDKLFESIDGFICPSMPVPVPTLDSMAVAREVLEERAEFINFTAPFNYSGHPTISLPTGIDQERRPAGFQIVGRKLEEGLLVQMGAALETAFGFTEHPLP